MSVNYFLNDRWNLSTEPRTSFRAAIQIAAKNLYLPAGRQVLRQLQLLLKLPNMISEHSRYRLGCAWLRA